MPIDPQPGASVAGNGGQPWFRLLTRYHWFVLLVAALGWLFDTMDQQLFTLARAPSMTELLAPSPGVRPDASLTGYYGPLVTAIFLVGWATGGLAFGILGDRIGRAKVMLLTILVYSAFTGLSAFSTSIWDFALWRFLTGLGVGGEFAVGVALVAEVVPERARSHALGWLQALSATGNVSAALIGIAFSFLEGHPALERYTVFGITLTPWRLMFVVGTLPALLAVLIRRRLKEPERWQSVAGHVGERRGSLVELFGTPVLRRNALVGLVLASAGVIGLWGIGFFSPDLTRPIFRQPLEDEARRSGSTDADREFVRLAVQRPEVLDGLLRPVSPSDLVSPEPGVRDVLLLYAAALDLREEKKPISAAAVLAALDRDEPLDVKQAGQSPKDRQRRAAYLAEAAVSADQAQPMANRILARSRAIEGQLSRYAAYTLIFQQIGAFFGIYVFKVVTERIGRRPTFAIFFVLAALSTAMTFWYLNDLTDIFWMTFLMGFFQLALFGGYAIYFPELFPTRLRSTGTSFCYNVGRFVAAVGPYTFGYLNSVVFVDKDQPMRYSGLVMCTVFFIGLLALPFAPETKGQPLPE